MGMLPFLDCLRCIESRSTCGWDKAVVLKGRNRGMHGAPFQGGVSISTTVRRFYWSDSDFQYSFLSSTASSPPVGRHCWEGSGTWWWSEVFTEQCVEKSFDIKKKKKSKGQGWPPWRFSWHRQSFLCLMVREFLLERVLFLNNWSPSFSFLSHITVRRGKRLIGSKW